MEESKVDVLQEPCRRRVEGRSRVVGRQGKRPVTFQIAQVRNKCRKDQKKEAGKMLDPVKKINMAVVALVNGKW